MKKYISKILSLLICGALSLSMFACTPQEEGSGEKDYSKVQNSSDSYEEFIDTYVEELRYNNVSDSSTYFIQNGVSDYKILVSNNEDSYEAELKAAEEIKYFIYDAYGFKLDIVFDTDESVGEYDTSKKYLSIGNTKFYKASPLNGKITQAELGVDGFKIETYGNVVIMNAYGNNGKVYAAYGWLERNMDYKYYAKDEWRITKEPNVLLKNMSVLDRPEFESRFLDTATNSAENIDWIVRLRHHGSQGGRQYPGTEGGGWIGSDQSLCLEFLKAEKYCKDHPSWFTGDGLSKSGQMCISTVLDNQDDKGLKPLDTMVSTIINEIVIPNPTKRVFMLGINDNATHQCRCEDCSEEVSQIRYSGQMCLLANAIKLKLNEWQESLPEDDPNKNRYIQLSFFAYLYTLEAPVVYDAANDTYKPVPYDAPYECLGGTGTAGDGDYSDLTLDECVTVRIAPIESVNMHTHYDREYNEPAYTAFESWSQISSKLSVWDYGTTFSDYISPYPDWGENQDDLKYFRAKNVTELLTQLPAHTSGTSFFAMMLYVRSQLMWDMDQSVEELYKDFIYNYYGPQAFDAIYGYFTFLRNYMQMADSSYLDETGQEVKGFINANGAKVEYHGYIYEVFTTERWFPLTTLMQLKAFFTEAEAQLALVKDTEPKYQKYLDRVQVESLFSRYIELKCYRSYYSNEQVYEMTSEFERISTLGNLTQTSNAGKNGVMQIQNFIAGLYKGIN